MKEQWTAQEPGEVGSDTLHMSISVADFTVSVTGKHLCLSRYNNIYKSVTFAPLRMTEPLIDFDKNVFT